MSEEFEAADGGINRVGWYAIAGVAVLIVVATVYGIMHTGVDLGTNREAAATDETAINVVQLRDEARATPAPESRIERTAVSLVEAQPGASPSPNPARTPNHQKSAEEVWREQETLKAREASPIVAAFEPKPNQTKEIPSLGQSKLQSPPSPWAIDEGSVISAILMFGVNSDYPGDLVAQIERPLYDSATGRYLLVPAGSRLIGKFQAPTGPFQERVSIAWHRLILPNNWSMELPSSPSLDGHGYAAVGGDVNHHYAATLAAALLSSVLTIGPAMAGVLAFDTAQTSPYGGGVYQTSPEQQMGMMATNSIGSQMGNTASRYMNPYLNRPNTVTIPPGTRFDVFINADLVLPGPYTDSAGQLINTAQH